MKKKGLNYYFIIIIILVLSFTANFVLYNYSLEKIRDAKIDAVDQIKKYDFDLIWSHLELSTSVANDYCKVIANNIEKDIRTNINLHELENILDTKNTIMASNNKYIVELHKIVKKNIENVHFGNIKNNRNSMIVLEGNDFIIEDMFVDSKSRTKDIEIDSNTNRYLSMYRDTTYNKKLFDTALNKIRTRAEQPIAIEPYNYLEKDHMKIKDMTYSNLKKVYDSEGLNGLRNYQFLVPVYITDTGDIFGNYDTTRGNPQRTHKFTVILTFNLYDQLTNINHYGEQRNEIEIIQTRYDNILGLLYIFGTVLVIVCVLMLLSLISASNHVRYPHDKCVQRQKQE